MVPGFQKCIYFFLLPLEVKRAQFDSHPHNLVVKTPQKCLNRHILQKVLKNYLISTLKQKLNQYEKL